MSFVHFIPSICYATLLIILLAFLLPRAKRQGRLQRLARIAVGVFGVLLLTKAEFFVWGLLNAATSTFVLNIPLILGCLAACVSLPVSLVHRKNKPAGFALGAVGLLVLYASLHNPIQGAFFIHGLAVRAKTMDFELARQWAISYQFSPQEKQMMEGRNDGPGRPWPIRITPTPLELQQFGLFVDLNPTDRTAYFRNGRMSCHGITVGPGATDRPHLYQVRISNDVMIWWNSPSDD